uniref:Uncharacterized protein n=1 Tax=Rhizophora mucronata TaxID=61149 RepID=A0A2P2QWM0_RHIMU
MLVGRIVHRVLCPMMIMSQLKMH